MPFIVHVIHFGIGNRRTTARTPINDAISTIDVSFFIERLKNVIYRMGQPFIKRKSLTAPVAGNTQFFQLFANTAAIFFRPCPRLVQKFFPSNLLFGFSFRFKLLYHFAFGGNGSMIRSRYPQGFIAGHAFPANENILQRIVHRMTHVQLTGNVWRRHDDGIRRLLAFRVGNKIAIGDPGGIDTLFKGFRIVGFFQIFHTAPLNA